MKILEWLLSGLGTSKGFPSKSSPADIELRHDLSFVRAIVIVGFFVGLVALTGFWYWKSRSDGFTDGFTIFLWALACYAIGSLAGFLFGIPRVLQGRANSNPPSSSGGPGSIPGATYQLLINTNLDDISDWLTKIVVGVGLVQLRAIPGFIYRLAVLIAGKNVDQVPFTIAVVLYFTILGFICGYLTTRMFIQRAFRVSDLAAGGISTTELRVASSKENDHVTTSESSAR